ncbi:hypothetical protein BGY98DRAFT_1189321 [Russula aff. rugulosa BPL654]|nr:hypothetical protein BGY98DRAFT_1189321 [Russula aff. rugulosa BPL654]
MEVLERRGEHKRSGNMNPAQPPQRHDESTQRRSSNVYRRTLALTLCKRNLEFSHQSQRDPARPPSAGQGEHPDPPLPVPQPSRTSAQPPRFLQPPGPSSAIGISDSFSVPLLVLIPALCLD